MSRTSLPILAFVLVTATSVTQAQDRLRFELRAGGAFPVQKLGDATLETGFGFDGTAAYRIQPHLSVFTGWSWHRFASDASFAGADNDFEETGYTLGLLFQHPIRSGAVSWQLRAGATLTHVEIENAQGDLVTDSEHGLGWEAGAGLAVGLGNRWQLAPGVRLRSLARDFTIGAATTSGTLRYLAVDLGISRTF